MVAYVLYCNYDTLWYVTQTHAPRNLNKLPHGKFHKPLCRFDRNWQGKAGQSAKKTMQLDGSATLPSQKHQILNWFILVSNGFHLRERRDKVETMKCESNENHLRIILLHEPLQ